MSCATDALRYRCPLPMSCATDTGAIDVRRCEPGGEQNCLHHALWIRNALAGDVERGSVVDGRADDRQSERHVHSLPEGGHLDRYQPLIVIAGNHRVKFSAHRAEKNRIAWKR